MSKKNDLSKVLEKLQSRLSYKKLDEDALDISRACAAGSLGVRDDFQQWAMITDNPQVVVNYVKTFITTLANRISSAPFRPESDELLDVGIAMRLNSIFTEMYSGVLNDGYAFLGIGVNAEGHPEVRPIDPRYILFNGDDPTLRDSTDVVIFEIVPRSKEDDEELMVQDLPQGFVNYDPDEEKVIVSHYHRVKRENPDGISERVFMLDVYSNMDDEPRRYELTGLDRIPVVRFVGEKVELSDKRYHYRGVYYQMHSLLKALSLTATKVQIRVASSDDDNYFVDSGSIMNHPQWENSGSKPYDSVDDNGNPMQAPVPIAHDNQYLIQSFDLWKNVISDMLGPVVQSGSDSITREEVQARSEVRDAIANTYLEKMVDSISEVYRCIQMFITGNQSIVVIQGGYIEQVKRVKSLQELDLIYNKAKEAGLNTQGFISEYLKFSDLPSETKDVIANTIKTDPFASPIVQQLKQQIAERDKQMVDMRMKMAVLELKASVRAEHQETYVNMTERVKNADIALEKWKVEQKQTQDARMELLKGAIERGDTQTALGLLQAISVTDRTPIATATVQDLTVNTDNTSAASPIELQMANSAANGVARAMIPQQGVSNGVG